MMIRGGILTASDKGSRGERQDESGETIRQSLSSLNIKWIKYVMVPDEVQAISSNLREWADESKLDVIFTTGGTGLSPRDVTPEATLSVIDRLVPGFSEVMRTESLKKTPHAMLSRAVSGLRGNTLIINLPGSPRAVKECLEAIMPALPHALETVMGQARECATLRER